MNKDNVNHPSHYTSHPSGVECIEITRHYCFDIGNAIKYLWRCGLKHEAGMSDKEKEVEDCNKAVWYLNDYLLNGKIGRYVSVPLPAHPSGVDCETVASCYGEDIADAFRELWYVGLIVGGCLLHVFDDKERIRAAIDCIRKHIDGVLSA